MSEHDAPVDDREALCHRCGVCCMAALRVNGRVVAIRELGCRFLVDVGKGAFSCSVYDHRFEKAPWCRTVPQVLPEGVLAATCGYRDGQSTEQAPVRMSSRLVKLIAPNICAVFDAAGWPEWIDADTLPEWLRPARID